MCDAQVSTVNIKTDRLKIKDGKRYSMQTLIIIKLECLHLCQIKPTSEQEILPGIKLPMMKG